MSIFDIEAGKRKLSILLYGPTQAGKTAQIGAFAKAMFMATGKKLRLYAGDTGGWGTIQPHIDLGFVELVDCTVIPHPWEMVHEISEGKIYEGGRWKPGVSDAIGAYAYEGFTGYGDLLMLDASEQAGSGRNIGGQAPATKFMDGGRMISGNSQSHFGSAQTQLGIAANRSFRLPGILIWTATAKRVNDDETSQTMFGPEGPGKAMTPGMPRTFNYTFHIQGIPGDKLIGQVEEHRLYFSMHRDPLIPGAIGMGNPRTASEAQFLPKEDQLPEYIAPADLVKAIEMIHEVQKKVTAMMAREMGIIIPADGRI